MELYKKEFQKVIRYKYFSIFLIGFLLLNVLLCFRTSEMEIIHAKTNKQLFNYINKEEYTLEEVKNYLSTNLAKIDIHSSFTIYNVYKNALNQVEAIENYDKYLDNIQINSHNLSSISIFGEKNNFTYRSIIKMPQYYKHLQGTVLVFGNSQTVVFATNRVFTDLFVVLMIFIICSLLFIKEKESGVQNFLKATKYGRKSLVFAKMAVCFTFCIILTFLFYGSNFLSAISIYGKIDLFRPLQSLEGFMGSTLKVSINGYLFIYITAKFLTFFLIAMFIILLSILARNAITVYAGLFFILGTSLFFYKSISENSQFAFMKFMSPIGLLKTNTLFKDYIDLNFFGFPVNIISSAFAVMLIMIFLISTISIITFAKQRMLVYKTGFSKQLIYRVFKRKTILSRLFISEANKVFIINRQVWIVVFSIFLGLYSYSNYRKPFINNDNIYHSYLVDLEGEVNNNTYAYYEIQKEYFYNLRLQLDALNILYEEGNIDSNAYDFTSNNIEIELENENILDNIIIRANKLKDLSLPKEKKAWLLYDTGYSQLLNIRNNQDILWNQIILLLLMVSCFAPIYSSENNMKAGLLLKSTKRGRIDLYISRLIIGAISTLILFICTNLPYLINTLSSYGIRGIHAPVQSLDNYNTMPFSLTIGQFLILVYLLKFVISLLCMWIMISLSIYASDLSTAIILITIVFIIPFILILLNVDFMRHVFYNPFILTNTLFSDKISITMFTWFIVNGFIVCISSILLIYNSYKKACFPYTLL